MQDASSNDPSEQPHDVDSGVSGESSVQLGVGCSLFTGISTVCSAAVRLTGVDGAAVAVLSGSSRARELVYATDAIAQQLDDLQFVIGEGPCLDAYVGDCRELWPDLAIDTAAARWPAFTADALALGVRATFAFPVPGAWRPIGVLELYRSTAGTLATYEQESAAACATAVGQALQANWDERVQDSGSVANAMNESALDLDRFDSAAADHSTVEFTRSQVHLAAGMAAVQLAVPTNEALDRLRAYAYAQGRPISVVAADIVARRLSLRDQRDPSEGR